MRGESTAKAEKRNSEEVRAYILHHISPVPRIVLCIVWGCCLGPSNQHWGLPAGREGEMHFRDRRGTGPN